MTIWQKDFALLMRITPMPKSMASEITAVAEELLPEKTANWVAAGAVAKLILQQENISIHAGVTSVSNVSVNKPLPEFDWSQTELNPVRCPDAVTAKEMQSLIEEVRDAGDTVGGIITCEVKGCPPGMGRPCISQTSGRTLPKQCCP